MLFSVSTGLGTSVLCPRSGRLYGRLGLTDILTSGGIALAFSCLVYFVGVGLAGWPRFCGLGVVMFCGCFDEGTWIRKRLQPIRGELSILSFIFILGHLATYLPTYLGMLGSLFGAHANVAISFVLAMVLTVLSFRVVRRAIDPHVWKNLQRASYVMLALLVLHVMLVLWRSAIVSGQTRSVVTFAVYVGVAVVYAALRIAKAVRDARKRREKNAECALEGTIKNCEKKV